MPKKLPEKVKLKALEMYLTGDYSAKDIAVNISKQFKVKVAAPTIYVWIREDDWKSQKALVKTEAITAVKESESHRFARMQTEHLNEYERLRQKAVNELSTLTFDRASDAAKALDLGIRGERVVMEGLINLQFVQDVLNVLIEEIQDQDIIKKVAIRLKTIVQEQE